LNVSTRWRGAEQEAKPDDAVADDHDGCENRVAGESPRFFTAGEHQRDDQRSVDDRDGEREKERAEWLADAERNDFRMVHGGKDGRDQGGGHEADEGPAEFVPPGHRQKAAGENRRGEAPDRYPVQA
jgi:hypothetical protein